MCTSVLEYEEWKDINGYEGLYQVSSFGRIKALAKYINHPTGSKSFIKEKILTGKTNKEGYCVVTLTKDKKAKSYLVHRLVAKAFIDNPNNYPVINHIWENQKSNNNKNNLEWCSVRYNNCYGSRLERIAQKQRKKVYQYNFNGELIKIWDGLRIIARELNVSESNVTKACKGRYKQLINYVWRYEGDAFDKYDTPIKNTN